MNEKINSLIPKAIQKIKLSKMEKMVRVEKDGNVVEINGKPVMEGIVDKEYKGYISSMGASILQTGLFATIAFYANDSGKSAKSSYLLDAILRLINPDYQENDKLITYVIEKSLKPNVTKNDIEISNLSFNKLYLIEEEITDALIALKLALRTFKLSK